MSCGRGGDEAVTETDLQREIVKALRDAGFWVIRLGVSKKRSRSHGTQSGEPGLPDLYLVGLGHLEVKLPGKDLSPEQERWHGKAASEGVNHATVRSELEAMRTALLWRAERDSRGAA